MPVSHYTPTTPWTRLAQEIRKPVFTQLPPTLRPFLLAATLFAAVCVLTSLSDAVLLHSRISWALISLLVVAGAASLWGTRPAALVLALTVLYGLVVVSRWEPPRQVPPGYLMLLLIVLFSVCGTAVIGLTSRARLMQAKAETHREVVEALQTMCLPTALAEATGYDLCGLYQPAHLEEEVGGDFYDFYPTGTGDYCLLIGDVMGKGKEAAASTTFLRSSIRAFCSLGASPAQIISQLNTLIETQGLPFETASLFVGLLSPRTGCLRYASAGHEPALVKCDDGSEEVLAATGPILGVGLEAVYEEASITLGPKDSLLLLTDGVTEARNKHGEFLGSAGTWWMLRSALRAASAQDVIATLGSTLTEYIGATRRDDIALLLLQRTGR